MKILQVATISTIVVVLLGILMVAPVFFRGVTAPDKPKIMLSFDVHDPKNVVSWCNELSNTLKETDVKATIFFSGKIVEKYQKIVSYFGDGVDVGSQTYSYVDLTSLSDFSLQLKEVQKGKQVIDSIGNIDSKIFKGPYGVTDENIYYILSQCGIAADFSYSNQFNLFENGQFIKYDAYAWDGSFGLVDSISDNGGLAIISFDTSSSVQEVHDLILELLESDVKFVNASDLAGKDLTGRGV